MLIDTFVSSHRLLYAYRYFCTLNVLHFRSAVSISLLPNEIGDPRVSHLGFKSPLWIALPGLREVTHWVHEPIVPIIFELSYFRFKETAMRNFLSNKDSPRTSLEKAGDWIQYVLRHGGTQHLRAQVFNIPWYQYYLLDVIAFLVAIAAIIVMVITLACRCLCRICCKRRVGKTKND